MKTILITGGAGFIGANFIKMLISENLECKLIVVDKLTYAGNLGNLRELWKNDNLIFYKEDISNKQSVEDIFNKHDIDIVINFAAESHVDRSIEDSTPFVVSNILGTQVLLDVCMKKEVEKFIQISTDEVYGSLDDGGEPFTEDHPLKPNNPYAASKAGADLLVRAYNNTYEFPGIITRCSNDYGPYQFPEKLIPVIILNAMEGKKIPLYGDGSNIRDWIFVEDHCKAIKATLEKGITGGVYNFGGETNITNLEVARKILDLMDLPETLVEFVEDRKGHDYRYKMNVQKARKDLNWQPAVSLNEGLEKTIHWYLNSPEWIKNIRSGKYRGFHEEYFKLTNTI